jgi:hypothetical protein
MAGSSKVISYSRSELLRSLFDFVCRPGAALMKPKLVCLKQVLSFQRAGGQMAGPLTVGGGRAVVAKKLLDSRCPMLVTRY